jgi:hypothetical protein
LFPARPAFAALRLAGVGGLDAGLFVDCVVPLCPVAQFRRDNLGEAGGWGGMDWRPCESSVGLKVTPSRPTWTRRPARN